MRWREIWREIEREIGKEAEIPKLRETDFMNLKKISEDIAVLQKKIFELERKSIEQDIEFEKIKKELAELSTLKNEVRYFLEKISNLEKRINRDIPENLLHLEKKINILPELAEEKAKAITTERLKSVVELDERLGFLEEQVDRAFATMGFVKKSEFLEELKRKVNNLEKAYSDLSARINKSIDESKLRKINKEIRELKREIKNILKSLKKSKKKISEKNEEKEIEEINIVKIAENIREKKLKPYELMEKAVRQLK